jgi:hypothetical protein
MHSSSRGGARVKWIAVHTAEGSRSVASLLSFFQDISDPNRGSSHAGVDDHTLEQGGPWVPYDRSAWTLRNGNAVSDNLEACGFAAWSRAEWLRHDRMLTLIATWIAQRCKARSVPIRKLTPAQVRDGMSGVIGHVDYTKGTGDGTHTDPGPSFPWDIVIARARQIANPPQEEDDMTPQEFLATKVGKDANTTFDAYNDKPGTIGHYFRTLRQRTDEVEPILRRVETLLKEINEKM